MNEETAVIRLIDNLERLAALGLPVWSEELTDQVDPFLHELDEHLRRDPIALAAVLDYLENPRSEVVADWLRLQLQPDLSLDEDPPRELRYAEATIPTQPALFLAIDEVTVQPKSLRKLKKPWEHAAGWFFGRPQKSQGHDAWPVGRDGGALDFLVQMDLGAAASSLAGFGAVGLPADLIIQIFADLDVTVGPLDHRVVAFPSGAGGDEPLKPPRRSDVNDADPVLINPVGALTLPPVDELSAERVGDDRLPSLLRVHADRRPYDLNLFRNTSRDDEQHLGYVPMARMGGFPVPDLRVWKAEAESALGCTVRDIVVLYDGPTDPEPGPVPDPDRVRLMVLIDRARLQALNFDATFALAH
ncbi:hypothetical protein GHK92_15070 [Nocardioides sp. dk4132]|uniref:hypothetical protein n=1 Tax=unclassified Nocardioides TaxID=2615069 RepID=UPI001297B9B4|nr:MULTISPECIES: hypothetical protein [unclassified Nocardioides]MQW77193.1 hypothetical protein [Nocardioides sp. dk4132]QGA07958.1 hypothetical protein GFH29_11550 [Nocardioides sp. dk884]